MASPSNPQPSPAVPAGGTHPFHIDTFPFPGAEAQVAASSRGTNWPVVYLIHNNDELYVGETTSAYVRYCQHAGKGKNHRDRMRLNTIEIVFGDQFNKSAVLDIEQSLIQLFEADASIQKEKNSSDYFTLQNKNGGQSNQHDYYNRANIQTQLEEIWKELRQMKLAKNEYNEIRNSDLFKYSPYNSLTSEQEKVCRDIIRDMIRTLRAQKTGTAVIRGVAGTGKSIVMINMITTIIGSQKVKYNYTPDEDDFEVSDRMALHKELDDFFKDWKRLTGRNSLKIGFVVPMVSIRDTFKSVFVAIRKTTHGVKANMVIGPNDVVTKPGEEYDVVFVDEAHRLKQRKAMSGFELHAFDECCGKIGLNPQTATSLDFILAKTKYRVLVYDENQTVKSADIPTDVIKKKIDALKPLRCELRSQMRCHGSGDFMQYVDDIFSCNIPVNKKHFQGFEFKMYRDPNVMIDEIIKLDKKEGLCRTVAGYSWEWISNKKKVVGKNGTIVYREDKSKNKPKTLAQIKAAGKDPDIDLNGRKYYWNVDNSRWILKSDPEEIGCIHTTQGYDLNHVAVIFGREIDYDPVNKSIIVDSDLFFDRKAKEGATPAMVKTFVINAYKAMLVRGIKGCYVYAYNQNLRDFLEKSFVDMV